MASEKLKNVEVTIRKRVECEERAFHIVNKLVDGCVDDHYLTKCGKWISRSNYDDIVEERAIIELCGYPLCHEHLPNIPKKKYHISTKANKVYDISERKKFCSNQCFKASNNFKHQIPESPVWARDEDKIDIVISPHKGVPGLVGEEVIGQVPKKELQVELEKLEELDKRFGEKDKDKKRSGLEKVENKDTNITQIEDDDSAKNTSTSNPEFDDPNGGSSNEKSSIVEDIQKDFAELDLFNSKVKQITPPITHELNATSKKRDTDTGKSTIGHNIVHMSKVKSSGDKITESSSKLELLQKLLNKRKDVLPGMVDLQEIKGNKKSVEKSSSYKFQSVEEVPNPTKKDGGKKCSTPATIPSPLCQICQVLKRWVSVNTVEYLQFKTSTFQPVDSLTKNFSDLQVQVDCVNLSKNLDIQERQFGSLLGDGADSIAENEDSHKERKNVPDYSALKDEAEQFQLKVTEFITGKRPEKNSKEKTEDTENAVLIPTVDAYDQSLIRARIVLEKLDKSLPDLLIPMGLSVQDVSSWIRELVYTFRLERDTIIFKPAEWTLVSLLLLKMLSFRVKLVKEAFMRDSTIRHFSLVLKGIKHTVEDVDMYTREVLLEATVIFEPR